MRGDDEECTRRGPTHVRVLLRHVVRACVCVCVLATLQGRVQRVGYLWPTH